MGGRMQAGNQQHWFVLLYTSSGLSWQCNGGVSKEAHHLLSLYNSLISLKYVVYPVPLSQVMIF